MIPSTSSLSPLPTHTNSLRSSSPGRSSSGRVDLESILQEHNQDPHAGLQTLIARHNDLLDQVASLKSEREAAKKSAERSTTENQQLWRSLKAMSSSTSAGSNNRPWSDSKQTSGGLGSLSTSTSQEGLKFTPSPQVPSRRGMSDSGSAIPSLPMSISVPSFLPESSHRLEPSLMLVSPGAGPTSYEDQPGHITPAKGERANHNYDQYPSTPTRPLQDGRNANFTPSSSLMPNQMSLSASASSSSSGSSSRQMTHSESQSPLKNSRSVDEELAEQLKTPPSTGRTYGQSSMPPSLANSSLGGRENRFLPTIAPVSPLWVPNSQKREQINSNSNLNGIGNTNGNSSRGTSDNFNNSPQVDGSSSSLGVSQQMNNLSVDPTHLDRPRTSSSQAPPSSPMNAISASGGQNTNKTSSASRGVSQVPLPPSSPQWPEYPSSQQQQQQHYLGQPVVQENDTLFSPPSSKPLSRSSSATPVGEGDSTPTLTPALLPFTAVQVGSSNIRFNERGKEILSFIIDVRVDSTTETEGLMTTRGSRKKWKVEKLYNDILNLDSLIKAKISKQEGKSISALPDKSLFKDHSPHKSDQRKAIIQKYLQSLCTPSIKESVAICAFLTSNLLQDTPVPSPSSGFMEGWLTKRGRNFGGWQTRYYKLSNGVLSYYDTSEGSKLGEIPLHSAAIGRQSSRAADTGDDTYLHAFLIRTTKKEDKDVDADHILCAENDESRDAWVVALTMLQSAAVTNLSSYGNNRAGIGAHGTQPTNSKLGGGSFVPSNQSTSSPHSLPAPGEARRQSLDNGPTSSMGLAPPPAEFPPSISLPAGLDAVARGALKERRSQSELGQYSDIQERNRLQPSAKRDVDERLLKTSLQLDRPSSPGQRTDGLQASSRIVASNVSSPMNAVPLPTGYDFKKNDRSKKTKSSFWGFAGRSQGVEKQSGPLPPAAPTRPVFGVPLKEAVAISRVRPGLEVPSVVYRCVEYLEAKNAESEEGIYRLSGSANVIRTLKDRYNAQGDYNLLISPEYFDPHAIAGLLKSFLRELPDHLLTRELQPEFLQLVDVPDRMERVNSLGRLVARLPIEEYSLMRFFFAHLCVIAQNHEVSKMNLRNLGIVFSPTLGIPAPLFTLLLAEFDIVFAVDKVSAPSASIPILQGEDAPPETLKSPATVLDTQQQQQQQQQMQAMTKARNRNSQMYESSGADKLMEYESDRNRLREQAEAEEQDNSSMDLESFIHETNKADSDVFGHPSKTFPHLSSSEGPLTSPRHAVFATNAVV